MISVIYFFLVKEGIELVVYLVNGLGWFNKI